VRRHSLRSGRNNVAVWDGCNGRDHAITRETHKVWLLNASRDSGNPVLLGQNCGDSNPLIQSRQLGGPRGVCPAMGNRHSPNVQGAQLGPAHQRGFFCVGAKPVTRISTGAYLGTVFLRAIPFSGAEAPLVLNSMANSFMTSATMMRTSQRPTAISKTSTSVIAVFPSPDSGVTDRRSGGSFTWKTKERPSHSRFASHHYGSVARV
jgi:hypothetical protein